MDLEELQKKLYKEGAEFSDRPQAPKDYQPGTDGEQKARSEDWQKDELVEPAAEKHWWSFIFSRKFRLYALFSLAGILLLAVGLFLWGHFSFNRNALEFKIYGPEKVVSGESVNYIVQYKNNNNVALQNAKITFYLPDGSILPEESGDQQRGYVEKTLGEIGQDVAGQAEFGLQLTGLKDEKKKIKAAISFNPTNISSEYEVEREMETEIISVPLVLSWSLPEKVVSGQELNLNLQYLNDSDIIFNDLKLVIKYPSGFIFNEATPEPTEEKTTWRFAEMSAQENGEIKILGVLSGDGGEIKSFEAILGIEKNGQFIELARALKSTQIAQAPLAVWQKINGQDSLVADWGGKLSFEVFYQNTTKENIRGVTVSAKISPGALNLKTLNIPGGSFNGLTNTISWSSEGVPELGYLTEGQQGHLSFSVEVKSEAPVSSFADKNFVISSQAKISSPNTPLSLLGTQLGSENLLAIKLNSLLRAAAFGYFHDNVLPNSGPLPPRVNQTTTYTLYWSISNATNEIDNVLAEAFLPGNVQWQNNFSPGDQNISFDSSIRKITWQVGALSPGVGSLLPARQIAFQVALTPSVLQVGRPADLLLKTKITAQDKFTGQNLAAESAVVTTELKNDPGLGYGDGLVAE